MNSTFRLCAGWQKGVINDNYSKSTDLNFDAISQVHGDQVVALLCRVGTLQDFHVSLGLGKIQITWLCGRQKTSHSLFLDNSPFLSARTVIVSADFGPENTLWKDKSGGGKKKSQ